MQELETISGREVSDTEVGELNELSNVVKAHENFDSLPLNSFEIEFGGKDSPQFHEFVVRLKELNNSPVYVWTPRTRICGLFRLPSICSVDFSFPYSLNSEGILSISTVDALDRILLDWSTDNSGDERLIVEQQGPNWTQLSWPCTDNG